MRPRHQLAVVAVLLAAVLVALAGNGVEVRDADPGEPGPEPPAVLAAVAEPATADTPSPVVTTSLPVAELLPALAADVAGAVRAPDGTARPVLGTDGEVWIVAGPCGGQEAVDPSVPQMGPRHVVLDPGEGGEARGAESGGVVEAELNLDIARRVETILTDQGVAVALTRDTDTELGAAARGALGPALGALAVVSIHHAPAGDRTVDEPGPEVVHQIDDPASRRLAGLVHAELRDALGVLPGRWAALDEPGVKPLLNQRGADFHVVLQASAGVPAVRVVVAALGTREAALLASEEGRRVEAEALARAIARFLVTDEEGDGFVEPRDPVRQAPTTNVPGACG